MVPDHIGLIIKSRRHFTYSRSDDSSKTGLFNWWNI